MDRDTDIMLSFENQFYWLQEHGIPIQESEKERCMFFLKNNNYFYKLISFSKNFNGVIKNFDMLCDISTLDMELRYVLLKLCLDIEHFTKTYILRITTNDPEEDGYRIVQNVFANDDNPDELKKQIFSSVSYYKDTEFIVRPPYDIFFDTPSIWIVLELASFGKLRGFLKYLSSKRPKNSDLRSLEHSFKYINKLRNSCAHNRNLINNDVRIEASSTVLPGYILKTLGSDGFDSNESRRPLIRSIALSLRIHRRLCSPVCHAHRINDLEEWLDRTDRHKDFYVDNEFQNTFNYIRKCVDIYK
ncbi:MAG: Abi family protein [Liquorilactobacillus sp.]|uniref:Abi family protein n=1 Tax=Liquorilactobacillus nagelii TaxID=82688 RepID=UPI0039ED2D5B